MIAIVDNQSLTDEVLSTTMCLVEQALNARPLTAVSDDPEDLTTLTPNHSLLGRKSASAPFMPSIERYHDLRKSFKTAQAYVDMIWKDGLVNTFHNGTRDRSGQTNMCET